MKELDQLKRVFGTHGGLDLAMDDVLRNAMETVIGMEVMGVAERGDGDEFRVSHVVGDDVGELQGATFTVGEGFLGNVVATRQARHWTNIFQDPRASLFSQNCIQVSSVFCWPVAWKHEVIGVLFAGFSSDTSTDMQSLVDVLFSMVAKHVLAELLEERLLVRTTRLTSIMELSQAMGEVEDVRNILYILLDMSLNLVQGPFSCIAFKRTSEESTVELLSRGVPRQKAAEIGRQLTNLYIGQDWNALKRGPLPIVRSVENMDTIECPMHFQNRVTAVLAVGVSNQRATSEFTELVYVLSLLGNAALHRIFTAHVQNWNRDISLVHRTSLFWANDSYKNVLPIQEIVRDFSNHLRISERLIQSIEQAALLSQMSLEFVSDVLPGTPPDVLRILTDFRDLCSDTDKVDFADGAQILALASHHHGDRGVQINRVSERLREQFSVFLLKRNVETQSITLDDVPATRVNGPNTSLASLPFSERLTARELEVLNLLVTGLGNKELAQTLFISEHTVKNHLTNIFQKLGVNDKAQAIAYVYKYQQE
ncbi:helix-turn-helix transcriptional regulator [Alicyclobacillus suci]|uniref:helix-turn-helix transcriptional regulator n=1 Tax=Alicyclobacillus suci TaxID=2816080 RepID=UPI002E2DF2A3|nr:helix-turn-helix transcriptional regulator [Alicyclobacillus suci]